MQDAGTWIDPALHAAVASLADPATGLAAVPSSGAIRPGCGANGRNPARSGRPTASSVLSSVRRLAETAASDPLSLDDAEWVALLEATGGDLDALTATADDVRRYTVGEAVTLVVNRNLTSSGLRTTADDDPTTFTLDDVGAIAADAWQLGATELCVQGLLPATEDPDGYLEIARAVKAAAPGLHLHAYRPQDVWDLAERGGLGLDGALAALREAGVDTVPGTGVKVLSERVRGLVAPGDIEIDRWTVGITAAHRAGFRSTSVLFYGHVETAAERIAHLRLLRADPVRDRRLHRVRADPAPRTRRWRAARPRPRAARRAPRDGRRVAARAQRQHPAHPDPVDPRRPRDRVGPAAAPAATTWAARCWTAA